MPEMWVVWSEEHGGWWASPSGYTRSLERAHLYTEEDALRIEADANRYVKSGYHEVALPDPREGWQRRG